MLESSGTNTLNDLRRGYVRSLNDKLSLLMDASQNRNFDTVVRLGHQLKGSGYSYGFSAVSELGGRIEEIGKDRRSVLLESVLLELKALINALMSECESSEKP